MNKKKFLPPFLILIFSILGFTRIEGANEIKPIIFASILVIGIGLGILIKSVIETLRKDKKNS